MPFHERSAQSLKGKKSGVLLCLQIKIKLFRFSWIVVMHLSCWFVRNLITINRLFFYQCNCICFFKCFNTRLAKARSSFLHVAVSLPPVFHLSVIVLSFCWVRINVDNRFNLLVALQIIRPT